jgi:hypothetical protein
LLRVLKGYKPSTVQSVIVGIVGLANVGKSSLIDTMGQGASSCFPRLMTRALIVAAMQPDTRRELQVSSTRECPADRRTSLGVIFEADDSNDNIQGQKGSSALPPRNVVKPEDGDDAI